MKAANTSVHATFHEGKAGFTEVQGAFPEVKPGILEVQAAFPEVKPGILEVQTPLPEVRTAFTEVTAENRSRQAPGPLVASSASALPFAWMRRRTQAETIAAIVEAFHQSRTWTQSALAERVGVETRRVKAYLDVLIDTKQFPLERMTEGRHVYWSLPKGWVAGGATVSQEEIAELVRILARAPRSGPCTQLLAKFLACSPLRAPRPVEPDTVTAPSRGDWEERMLAHAESSAARRVSLRVRYHTASRDELTERTLSVQRIQAGPPARLIAWCHRSQQIKTFRVDRIKGAVLDPGVAFVLRDAEEIDAYVAQSVEGYHGPRVEAVRCRFRVRDPEALWVAGNLPAPMRGTRRDGGLDVEVETSAVEQVARFVVGLGGAALPLTPELRARVRALAEGALAAMDG